jgi:hypothetical protein
LLLIVDLRLYQSPLIVEAVLDVFARQRRFALAVWARHGTAVDELAVSDGDIGATEGAFEFLNVSSQWLIGLGFHN